MNKLGAGIALIVSGCIMQCAKVIAAAIYMSGTASQSNDLFENGMEYVGGRLDIMAAVAVCTGAALAVWHFVDSNKKK